MAVNVAVVGATGAVGDLMRRVLAERAFPVEDDQVPGVREVGRQNRRVPRARRTPSSRSARRRSPACRSSCSSTPVVGEQGILPDRGEGRGDRRGQLVGVADGPGLPAGGARGERRTSCTTPRRGSSPTRTAWPSRCRVALKPLHDLGRVKRIVVATYQSSSGKGAKGLVDFDAQLKAFAAGGPVPAPTAHRAQLAGNVVTLDWTLDPNGYTEEENKVINETRKILGDATHRRLPDVRAGAGEGGPQRGDHRRVRAAGVAWRRRRRRWRRPRAWC